MKKKNITTKGMCEEIIEGATKELNLLSYFMF